MTQREQVLAVLEEGPCTCNEVALETGLPLKHCSAYLTQLKDEGRVAIVGKIPTRTKASHLYSLIDGG